MLVSGQALGSCDAEHPDVTLASGAGADGPPTHRSSVW